MDKILENLQKASRENRVDIKDIFFIEVPQGRLRKPKRYSPKKHKQEKEFEQKQLRIKQISHQINSKL